MVVKSVIETTMMQIYRWLGFPLYRDPRHPS